MQGNPGYLATCWDFHHAITAFSAGGLSHVFCDALTIQGVALGWWSDRKFNLSGGRFHTSRPSEYVFSGIFVAVYFGIAVYTKSWHESEHSPIFYDWADYCKRGLIDGHEWKQNRFRNEN